MKAKTKRLIGYGMLASFVAGCLALMSARLVIDGGWGGMAEFWITILCAMVIIGAFALVAMWLIESKDKP